MLVETSCFYYNVPLGETVCATQNAKLVTMKGKVEGNYTVKIFVKIVVCTIAPVV